MRKVLKIDLAKHGLNKPIWIRPKLVSFGGRPNRREREGRGKERRRGRGRGREEEAKPKRYETTKIEYGSLVCRIIILPKPRVLLGFHPNPKIMESKVGKTLNSTISI